MQLKNFDFKGLYNSKDDPKEVFKELKTFPHFLDHLKGELMTYPRPRNLEDLKSKLQEQHLYALAILAKHTYTTISTLKQTEQPRLCSATPILLAAMKEAHGVSYESWELHKRDPNILGPSMILGLQLGKLFKHRVSTPQKQYDIASLRVEALTAKKGNKAISPFGYTLGKTSDSEFDELPVFYRHMLLQTWVFHPNIRHPDMITNIYNMDEVVEPILDLKDVPRVKEEVISEIDPWSL